MKIENVLGHPLAQLISFSVLLVGSAYFGGPFLFFVYHSFLEAYLYGVLGVAGVVVTLLSLFVGVRYRAGVQFAGLVLMIASVGVFVLRGSGLLVYRDVWALVSYLLFGAVVVFVIRKTF